MSTPDTSEIENQEQPSDNTTSGLMPNIVPESSSVAFHMMQCVEGGWERETADGRMLDVDSNFSYVVDLQFENKAGLDAFFAREDFDEVNETMIRTMREMTQETFDIELERDFNPLSYDTGVLPDDTTKQFADTTIYDLDSAVLPDFVNIMNSAYPDLGLVGATVDPNSVNQSPGCFEGVPNNLAELPDANMPSGGTQYDGVSTFKM